MLNEIPTNDGNYSFTIDVCCLQALKPTSNILDTSVFVTMEHDFRLLLKKLVTSIGL